MTNLLKFIRIGIVLPGVILLVAAMFAAPATAARIALVIGNDDYVSLPVLQKAENDARSVAVALEDLGFKVFLGRNLKRRETNRLLADFEAAIQPGDQTFFFFAGHGVAIGAENYLIPSDMPQPRAGEEGLIRDEAHSVHSLIERIQRKGAASAIFVLDACRDNPFAATGVRSIGTTRGLTRVQAPNGVFVLFSAGTGQAALDRLSDTDNDANSVFTRKLIPLLKTPGLTHVSMAKRLQKQVSTLARTVSHEQQPAYYDQIIGEIVLKPAAETNAVTSSAPSNAAQAWSIIQDTSSPAVLNAYIKQFPGSVYAGFAQARLKELQPANKNKQLTNVEPGQSSATGSAEPSATTEAVSRSPADRTELIRAIQERLNWHRCDAGRSDGQWGARSRRAVTQFAKYAKLTLATLPSDSLLDLLQSRKRRVCPATVVKPAIGEQPKKQVAKAKKSTEKKSGTRVYHSPKFRGLPVDICLTPGKKCKGQAADEFCRQVGYRVATASKFIVYPATRHLGTRGECRPHGFIVCGGYSTITCQR